MCWGGLLLETKISNDCYVRVLHHSKELWGENADAWSPERWLVNDTSMLDKHWIPVSHRIDRIPVSCISKLTENLQFGAGFNACPGQHVARMQLLKICSTVSSSRTKYEHNFGS